VSRDGDEGAPTPKGPTEDASGRTELELGIEIDADGRVVFTELPPELLEVVSELDPDAVIACAAPPGTPATERRDRTEPESGRPGSGPGSRSGRG